MSSKKMEFNHLMQLLE